MLHEDEDFWKFLLKELVFILTFVNIFFRNTVLEIFVSVLLALGISILGSLLLAHGFFQDFAIFWMCFVMAGCQYSLLKVNRHLLSTYYWIFEYLFYDFVKYDMITLLILL